MNLKFLIYTLSSYQLPVLISSSSWQKYPASFLPFAPLCLLQVTTFTLVVSKNSRFPSVFLRSCELTKNKFPHTTPQQKTRTITLNDKTLLNSTRVTCFPSVQCTMLGIQSFGQRLYSSFHDALWDTFTTYTINSNSTAKWQTHSTVQCVEGGVGFGTHTLSFHTFWKYPF